MAEANVMAQLELNGRLDAEAALPLAGTLRARRGSPLAINAAGVNQITTPCMQVLLAAAAAWRADGLAFHIADASQEFAEAALLLGFTQQQLPMEPTTP